MTARKSPPTTIGAVKDIVPRLALCAGWPSGISAVQVAKQVYQEHGA